MELFYCINCSFVLHFNKIEKLSNRDETPEKDTLDRLSKLMDYHDRIKATPNSSLNFRSSLNFLNSLLLPLLAFILANLDTVMTVLGIGGVKTKP